MSNCLSEFSIKALFQKSSHTGDVEFQGSRSHTLSLQLFERKGQDVFHLSPAFHQLRLSRHFTMTFPSRRVEMQPTVFWWINRSVFAVPGQQHRIESVTMLISLLLRNGITAIPPQIWEDFTPCCSGKGVLNSSSHCCSEGLVCSIELCSLNPDTLTPLGALGQHRGHFQATAKTVQMGRKWNICTGTENGRLNQLTLRLRMGISN